jgi:hypothetical protein
MQFVEKNYALKRLTRILARTLKINVKNNFLKIYLEFLLVF